MFDAVPLGDGADASGSELFDDARLAALNEKYLPLDFEQRIRSLYQDFAPEKVLVTSSFAATSAYFLHIISRIRPQQLIHFIDTGFHFPETLDYRRYLIDLFKLKVEDVRAEDWQHQFTVDDRTYQRDPDYCCSINKIQPLEGVKSGAEVWVSSLMRWQTDHRAGLPVFESRRGILKFNPMIDVTREERDRWWHGAIPRSAARIARSPAMAAAAAGPASPRPSAACTCNKSGNSRPLAAGMTDRSGRREDSLQPPGLSGNRRADMFRAKAEADQSRRQALQQWQPAEQPQRPWRGQGFGGVLTAGEDAADDPVLHQQLQALRHKGGQLASFLHGA